MLDTSTPATTTGQRQLLLLGAGPTHRQLLTRLAQHPLPGVQIALVSQYETEWQASRLAAFVAGRASAADCQIALESSVQRSGVHWLCAKVRTLDASGRTLSLDDGSTRTFDCLSIDTEALQDREQLEHSLPGARKHALFVTPVPAFAALWPQVCGLAEKRALRFTIVGAGATGTELALALQARFPNHSTTLLTGGTPSPCAAYPLAVQERVLQSLKQRRITVLQDTALQISDAFVQLTCGAALATDVTVLATPAQAPLWAQTSGLALCSRGLIAVDELQRSTSHPHVFVQGDCAGAQSAAPELRSFASAQAGEDLAQRLTATLADQPLPAGRARKGGALWSLLDLGHGQALASRGGWTVQGRWVAWIKAWLEQKPGA